MEGQWRVIEGQWRVNNLEGTQTKTQFSVSYAVHHEKCGVL